MAKSWENFIQNFNESLKVFYEAFLSPKLLVLTNFCLLLSCLSPKYFALHKYCSYLNATLHRQHSALSLIMLSVYCYAECCYAEHRGVNLHP